MRLIANIDTFEYAYLFWVCVNIFTALMNIMNIMHCVGYFQCLSKAKV